VEGLLRGGLLLVEPLVLGPPPLSLLLVLSPAGGREAQVNVAITEILAILENFDLKNL